MRNRRWLALAIVVAGGSVPAPAWAAVRASPAAPAGPQIASINVSGAQANESSYTSRVSGDGRYVAFASRADNLATNQPVRAGVENVYLKDRLTGSIRLISRASGGADGNSYPTDVSTDGRYVTFISAATNLVYSDTNQSWDVFRWDRSVDANTLVSVDSAGTLNASVTHRGSTSDDGRFVVFESLFATAPGPTAQIYVRNLQSQTTEMVSVNVDGAPGNGYSTHAVISGNGRFVAFQSTATDLVDPPISTSSATYVYVRDLMFGITWLVSLPNGSGDDTLPTINEDGSVVAYAGNPGIWVWEMFSNSTTRVDYGALGWANGPSWVPVLNADGTVLAFVSDATNLDADSDTNGVPDVFVTSPLYGGTHRVNTAGRGCEANGLSNLGDLSADGTVVVFDSIARNLTRRDHSSWTDVFVGPTRSHQPTEESNCKPVKD
jgi:Tol biopolymer transport system component